MKEIQKINKIYCDMDGVLVDFVNPVLKLMNQTLPSWANNKKFTIEDIKINVKNKRGIKARKYMSELVNGNINFWSNLPWMPGGKKLWNCIKKYNPTILTTPMDKASIIGKRMWVKNNLGEQYKVIISKNKFNFATNRNNTPNLLIDDFISNVVPFKKSGGITIHHESSAKSINTFIKIIQKQQ